ncbi:hypothetical protein GQX74_009475 [Glossina fuscipes]|nr:hypothetical protein GQX74_009475 [Glossina fuscipes]
MKVTNQLRLQRASGHREEELQVTYVANMQDEIGTSWEILIVPRIHTLNNIGIETATWTPFLLQILTKKLHRNLHSSFEQFLKQPKEICNIDDLVSILEFHFYHPTIKPKGKPSHPPHKRMSSAIHTERKDDKCGFCNAGSHALYQLRVVEANLSRFCSVSSSKKKDDMSTSVVRIKWQCGVDLTIRIS